MRRGTNLDDFETSYNIKTRNDAMWFRSFSEPHTKVRTRLFPNWATIEQDILSDREKEILHLLSEGKKITEIGKLLFISTNTVNNHRQNMINRLGAKDATALIQLVSLN